MLASRAIQADGLELVDTCCSVHITRLYALTCTGGLPAAPSRAGAGTQATPKARPPAPGKPVTTGDDGSHAPAELCGTSNIFLSAARLSGSSKGSSTRRGSALMKPRMLSVCKIKAEREATWAGLRGVSRSRGCSMTVTYCVSTPSALIMSDVGGS